ncbi:MAG: AraC family transcriptional regulator [Hyphomonadaceae bacterium]|nr:AraC family transcriptional regulator [Hyphomonadaceae bacterium]
MRDWTGRIALGDDWALFAGNGGTTPMHRHLAHKIVIALDGAVRVVQDKGAESEGQVMHVLPGAMHQVMAAGAHVGLYYADAASFSDVPRTFHRPEQLVELCQRFDQGDETVLSILAVVLKPRSVVSADQRVTKAVDRLRSSASARLDDIASSVGLSHSRFRNIFASRVGGAPARYRRWLRLRIAAERLGRGEPIVEAALAAGFSDAAHLNRTFMEMLGITPGMFRASTVIVLPSAATQT